MPQESKRSANGWLAVLSSALCLACLSQPSYAVLVIWGNGAGGDFNLLQAFDAVSGERLVEFIGPSPDALGFYGHVDVGRGIAVSGSTIYYTSSGSGKIFKTDLVTRTDDGIAFDTGLRNIRSVSYDGSTFWVRDDGSTHLRRYAADGTLLLTLPDFSSNFDVYADRILAMDSTGFGLFDFTGTQVAHLFDYDFPGPYPRGVAYDGKHVALNSGDNFIRLYTLTGTLLSITELGSWSPLTFPFCCDDRAYTDLSFIGRPDPDSDPSVSPPLPEAVPEPDGLILLGLGLIPALIPILRRGSWKSRA